MIKKKYRWKRLWVAGTGSTVDEVLTHPDYFTSAIGAEPLEKWQQTPCLILLGEPGMGKSAEWERQRLVPVAGANLTINLGDFSSGRDIVEELSDHPAVRRWLAQPESGLWLWLDSFDEALLHEVKLFPTLSRLLEQWPTTGLHLRILSRTATWHDFFTKRLEAHFGESPGQPGTVVVLQLAPLIQHQVHQAAEAWEIDPAAFITAVERAEAVPLATLPVTLNLLLRLWHAGRFGPDAGQGIQLLEDGCRLLCEEGWDEQRSHYQRADADQRLRVAAQLAVVMVCSRRRVLTTDELDDGELRLRLREVTDEMTLFQDRPDLRLGKDLVMDVLHNTGLFVPSATEVRWVHPVFADFLAAWALHKAQIGLPQLRNLFRSAVRGAGVVPALREVAVWLASLSPDFAAELVHLDPLTAMRADVLTASDAQRAGLVAELLAMATERHLYPRRAEPYLARLAHPQLAAQLTTVLGDPDATPEASWLAHQIAESCLVQQLAPLLIQQALEPTLRTPARTQALHTLRRIAGPDERHQLRPLRLAIPVDDKDDEFRGTLLHLLWPADLTARELLPLLTPQRKTSTIGAYHSFLDPTYAGGLRDGLAVVHLPTLLRWLICRPRPEYGSDRQMEEFVRNAVITRAWQHTEDGSVLPWLAFALRRLSARQELPHVPEEAPPRNRVLRCWVQRQQLPLPWELTQPHQVEPKRYGQQAIRRQAIVAAADFDLVLTLLRAATHPATVAILFKAALILLAEHQTEQREQFQAKFSALYELAQLRQLEAGRSWSWEREDSASQHARRRYFEEQHGQRARRRAARLVRRLNYRTYRLLIRLTDPARPNPARSWWAARYYLLRTSAGRFEEGTTEMRPGFHWLRSSTQLRQQLVTLAWRAVEAAPPQVVPGQRIKSFSEQQAAPLAALFLCQDERPEAIVAFTAAQWQPWLRAVLVGWVSVARRTELFGVALRHHRRATLRYLAAQHDFWQQVPADSYGYARLGELLHEVPDEVVWRKALQGVMAGRWPRQFSEETLGELLRLGFRSAELFQEALFMQNPTAPSWHLLTLAAFRERLFTSFPKAEFRTDTWWVTWQRLGSFGPEAVRALLRRLEGRTSWTVPLPVDLPDEYLIALLNRVVRDLGVSEEDEATDWHRPAGAGKLRLFRNAVAKLLAGRATALAWQTLEALAVDYRYPRWLTYMLEEARETHSRHNWTPLLPAQLLQFLRHASSRWLQSSADLLDSLIESLDRLQVRLQGEPARAHDLWYPADKLTGYRIVRGNKVVEENRVTDYVKAFLDDDLRHHLLSAQREVQLRAGSGAQQGQELDLYVQAAARSNDGQHLSGERLMVFIEAKHQDNPEVQSALDKQLVNRYLRNHSARAGLFLVYWYKPYQQGTDKLTALRQQLDQQAQHASQHGLLVKSYVLDIRLPDDQV